MCPHYQYTHLAVYSDKFFVPLDINDVVSVRKGLVFGRHVWWARTRAFAQARIRTIGWGCGLGNAPGILGQEAVIEAAVLLLPPENSETLVLRVLISVDERVVVAIQGLVSHFRDLVSAGAVAFAHFLVEIRIDEAGTKHS